ncbi:hypothetical protein [Glycomyces arizonensis]|uniref:hypothetical protein n=1 Tax=Glycomyces arizonensis TaxID=256035 RepID=UPI000424D4A6|nr:hypothetical protein [Glycomyces arizonensis]
MSGPDPALGLVEASGRYDAAGRRLFLPDGSPDPDTPGAYRYRHDPSTCDPTAPETDPANPRYEPPHLRHRPGDDWEIGGRPYDPDDPGPYGSPGWYQDQRTGRHRRAELPDPLPSDTDDEEPTRPHRPLQSDRPRPDARQRFWPAPRQEGDSEEEPYRFSNLREDAWDRWLIDSEPLAAAHRTPPSRRSAIGREAGLGWALWTGLAQWLIALFTGSPARRGERRSRSLPQPGPTTESRHRRAPVARRTAPPPLPRQAGPVDRAARADRAAAMARAVAGARRARTEAAAWA